MKAVVTLIWDETGRIAIAADGKPLHVDLVEFTDGIIHDVATHLGSRHWAKRLFAKDIRPAIEAAVQARVAAFLAKSQIAR